MPDDKIRITCPYEDCGQRFKLGASLAGKKVKCAKCRRRFLTPAKPGAPALKVAADSQTKTGATGALEPVTKGTGALEPISKGTGALEPKTGAQKPATSALEPMSGKAPAQPAADDMGLSLDTSATTGSGPQPAADDDMSLAGIDVSKPRTTLPDDAGFADPITSAEEAAGDMSLGLADSPPATSSAPGLDDDMLEGIDVNRPATTSATAGTPLQSVDDMEMGLDTPAPSTGAEPVQFSDEPEQEASTCPKCHGPVVATFQRCPTCGTKIGGAAKSGAAKGPKRKLPIFKIAALLMLGTFLYGGYWFWNRTRLVGIAGAIREGKVLVKKGLTKVGVSEEDVDKALNAVEKKISQDRIVVAAEDQLEIEDANKKMKVRQGQPMIQKKVEEGRAKVILKTPNGDIVGWVPAEKVVEVVDFDRSDLLGVKDEQPKKHSGPVADLVFKDDGKFLSSVASSSAEVNIWHASKSRLIRSYQGHQSKVVGAAFLSDGAVVSAESETGAKVWDPLTTATLRKLPDFKGFFRPIGDNRCIEVHEGKIKIWDLKQGRMASSAEVALETSTIRISRTKLLARNAEGKFLSIKLPSLEAGGEFEAPFEYSGYDISPDGILVAFVPAERGQIVLVDSSSGEEKAKFSYSGAPAAQRGQRSVQFCGSSGHLAVVKSGKQVEVIQISKVLGVEIKKTINSKAGTQITTIASAPSGRMLGVGYSDGSVQAHSLDFIKTSTGSSGGTAVAATKAEKTALRNYTFIKQFILNKKPEMARMYFKGLKRANPDSPLVAKAREQMVAAGIDMD